MALLIGLLHKSDVYLYNLVFLWFIDLSSQAAARDSIMDDKFV